MSTPYRIPADQSVFLFSPDNRPVLEVEDGADVVFEARDAFSGQISSEHDLPTELDFARVNAATGPLAVRSARPGQTLAVDVLAIDLDPVGYQCVVPGFGVLRDRFPDPLTRECIVEEGYVVAGGRRYPVSPNIGTIGVAPEAGEVPTISPGDHGGNLDTREITTGCRLYLPIRVHGALLAMGDVHAVQGDGEVCGVAVEIGARIHVRVQVCDTPISRPVVVTPTHIVTLASHEDLNVAAAMAVGDMVDLLAGSGWDPVDAYTHLTLGGHLGVAQAVNPRKTAKMTVSRPGGWTME